MPNWLSIIRFVPDPGRGEFINVGAIAGSDETEDWEVQTVSNWKRAKWLDERDVMGAVMDFISVLQARVDTEGTLPAEGFRDRFTLENLKSLSMEMRNVVQLTPPVPVLVQSAAEAIELAFEEMILDPQSRRFNFEKKFRAVSAVKEAYKGQGISAHRNARIRTGPYDSTCDFVVANGSAVQLVRCWSFQLPDQSELAEQVEAWAWGVRAFRRGAPASVMLGEGTDLPVRQDADIGAVYIPPMEGQQNQKAFGVALEAFKDTETRLFGVSATDAGEVARRARGLLGQ